MTKKELQKLKKKYGPNFIGFGDPKEWPSDADLEQAKKIRKRKDATMHLSKDAGVVERSKHILMTELIYACEEDGGYTQREFAKLIKIPESRVSEIFHYRHELFTIDRLLEFLERLNPKLKDPISIA